MTERETRILTNVIRRLRGESYSNDELPADSGISRIYLDTWVIPALHILVGNDPNSGMPLIDGRPRDMKLADDLTRLSGVEA